MKRLPLPRHLVRQVAWATWAAIAVSAGCVALVSGVLAERFADRRERQQLTDAAKVLAVELVEPGADPVYVASDEAREVRPTGIRVAVYTGTRLFAGDATLPTIAGGSGCRSEGSLMACAVSNSRFTGIAARDMALLREQRRSLVISGLLAVAVTSLLGALVARRIALSLVAPVSRLSLAVARVPLDAPETADLGADEGVEEVDRLRRALHTTFARLGHALATSRRFAADAAHELRSPLTVILGQLELSSPALTGEARASNDRARRTAASLSTLVDRLLVLATPAAKLTLAEELELHSAADDALDWIPVESWPRVQMSSDADVYVCGDRALLAAMIANAIENGLKFSDGDVRVRMSETSKHAEVRISDDGPGIPEAERERVFEPFFRTPASRASGTRGHGIGLSLIAHVCAVHGGTARFEPRERGTCLVLELPRAPRQPLEDSS